MAAGLTEDQTKENMVCPNKVQNVVVVSSPHECNTMKYARVCKIYTRMGSFEVSAYVAAPENTLVLEVKRIKATSAVVVLFDGMKVPDTVVRGTALASCYLYRRQVDVCYAGGQVGHRAYVCLAVRSRK
ncbi:hypothetical protein MTO96_038150 [Rhipicephalus appendiculatus]